MWLENRARSVLFVGAGDGEERRLRPLQGGPQWDATILYTFLARDPRPLFYHRMILRVVFASRTSLVR